jgi:hypothetical protein
MTPSQLFQELLGLTKNNLLVAAIPPVLTFLGNVKSNPNPLNVVAQADLLRAGLVAALPNLEQTEIAAIDTIFSNELQAVLTTAQAALTPSATAPVTK